MESVPKRFLRVTKLPPFFKGENPANSTLSGVTSYYPSKVGRDSQGKFMLHLNFHVVPEILDITVITDTPSS